MATATNNAIAIRDASQAVSRYEQREVIDTIKQTVCKGATDAQLKMFLEVCKATGLDPFLKEIWYVAEKGIIMAGRDGYLRVANEHPQFDGIETRVERDPQSKIPIKAVCTVWRKDRNHPTICEAYYNEYNKQSPVWKQYPSAMIGKVAEVLALKRSFAINGVVSEEEIGGEPAQQGSAAARDAVRDRKLAEIRQQQAQAAPPAPEVIDAEPVEEPAPPQASQETADASIKQRLEQFAKMREMLGDEAYYRILGINGYKHANDPELLRKVDVARRIYREMAEEFDAMQRSRSVV